jgi:hypothetical protein
MATKFTAARRNRILEALRRGHYLKHAAALAGVGERTVHDWVSRGREAKSGAYRNFFLAVEEADATAIDSHLEVIEKAEDPRVSLEFLGRRHPQEFAKVERQEVSGVGGEPIRVELKWPSGPQPPSEQ